MLYIGYLLNFSFCFDSLIFTALFRISARQDLAGWSEITWKKEKTAETGYKNRISCFNRASTWLSRNKAIPCKHLLMKSRSTPGIFRVRLAILSAICSISSLVTVLPPLYCCIAAVQWWFVIKKTPGNSWSTPGRHLFYKHRFNFIRPVRAASGNASPSRIGKMANSWTRDYIKAPSPQKQVKKMIIITIHQIQLPPNPAPSKPIAFTSSDFLRNEPDDPTDDF